MKLFFGISFFLLLFVMPGFVNEAEAQRRYVDHSVEEGVSIQYRWAHSKWWNKNSPLELRLKIKNNNDYPVKVSYMIEFYMGPMLEESSNLSKLCINPKLAKTGRLNGMYYRSSRLSNKQLESEEFSWIIEDMEIEEVKSCR